ncbi:MAG: TatD family hydrolase, partial [Dehalococcoidia bacterium]
GELEGVVRRAREAGVGRIITVGSTVESSQAAIRIAETYPDIYAGVGIHPMEVSEAVTDETMEELKQMAASSDRVVVISEPGLDYQKGKAPRELQQQVFRNHIRLSRELGLPTIFHSRDAYWDCLRILKEEHAYEAGAVMHYFVADLRIAEECIDMGIYVSFSKTLLSLPHLHEVAQKIPIEYMVLETDSSPQPWKKNPPEPAHVRRVAQKLAELKGLTLEEVAAQTTANLKYLVGPKLR